MAEGLGYRYSTNAKGLVRAFDAKTGRQIWRFNTIPYPGEFGNDTWEKESWSWTGNNGVWTQITVDAEAGLVYLPVESPTIDTYGGNRPGNNLFAETLVAVDLKTGVRKWHFQLVHHPLWNYDMSSAAIVADIVVDGKPIKAVAVPGKQGFLFVFDRVTGEPVWPIVERPVSTDSDVPGEKPWPTQPFPSRSPPFARQGVSLDDANDPQRAADNTRRLVDEQRVFVMFGNSGTPQTLAAVKVLQERGVPLIGTTSGADSLQVHNPLVFHYKASYGQELARIATHLKTMGMTRVAM